jgi:hypothetical protein
VPIPDNAVKELLSRGFLRLVAARAGFVAYVSEIDLGIDLNLRQVQVDRSNGRRFRETGLAIDVQLKATTESQVEFGQHALRYDLAVRNYNDMVQRANDGHVIPLFLGLVILPNDATTWLSVAESELTFRRCAYMWRPRLGERKSRNRRTQRISIPLSNRMGLTTFDGLIEELRT